MSLSATFFVLATADLSGRSMALSRRWPQAHQSDVVGLRVPGGEFTDILENRAADGDRAARGLGHSFQKAVVALGIVKLIVGATSSSLGLVESKTLRFSKNRQMGS